MLKYMRYKNEGRYRVGKGKRPVTTAVQKVAVDKVSYLVRHEMGSKIGNKENGTPNGTAMGSRGNAMQCHGNVVGATEFMGTHGSSWACPNLRELP